MYSDSALTSASVSFTAMLAISLPLVLGSSLVATPRLPVRKLVSCQRVLGMLAANTRVLCRNAGTGGRVTTRTRCRAASPAVEFFSGFGQLFVLADRTRRFGGGEVSAQVFHVVSTDWRAKPFMMALSRCPVLKCCNCFANGNRSCQRDSAASGPG